MVALWRDRFLTLGVDGLLRDASRPGRTHPYSREIWQLSVSNNQRQEVMD